MKKTTSIAALAAVGLALTGCSLEAGSSTSDTSSGSNRPSTSAETADSTGDESMDETSESGDSGTATFGETWEYDDGLTVTVSAPEAFSPTDTAAGGEAFDHHVKFTVTVVNGTGAPFDPSMITESVQSDNMEGDAVFDDGLEGAPMTTVLDGRETTFDVGYGVSNPDDIVLEVSPSFEHDSAIFTDSE